MKKKTIPEDATHLAALTILAADSWKENYSTYRTDFITIAELLQLGLAFAEKTRLNKVQDALRKQNTIALRNLNRCIDKSIIVLRRRIQAEYWEGKDLSGIYESHGLELPKSARKPRAKKDAPTAAEPFCPKPTKKSFVMPINNKERVSAMRILVAKLSEAGNPFASHTQGLAYFQALQTQHQQLWQSSAELKMEKTKLSLETRTYFNDAEHILRRLVMSIKSNFPIETKQVLRTFGFLK